MSVRADSSHTNRLPLRRLLQLAALLSLIYVLVAPADCWLDCPVAPQRKPPPHAPLRAPPAAPTPPPVDAAAAPPSPPPATPHHSGRTHCGGVLPLTGHQSLLPPYYIPDPDKCPVPVVHTLPTYAACLSRRGGGRLFFAGNSIARGIAFSVGSSFTGIHINRLRQKQRCRKANDEAANSGDASVSCTISLLQGSAVAPNGTLPLEDVRFMWRESFWNRTGDDGFCGPVAPLACWRQFFDSGPGGRHTSADVFISNGGRWYLEKLSKEGRLNVPTSIRNAVDDAKDFMAARVFTGPIVWLTTPWAKVGSSYGSFNPLMDQFNAGVAPELVKLGIHVIDYHAFYGERESHFTDTIHPWNTTYMAAVHHVLGIVC